MSLDFTPTSLLHMESASGFQPVTEQILKLGGIMTIGSILDISPAELEKAGVTCAVSDWDGVWAAFGQAPLREAIDQLEALANGLEYGLVIVTNNSRPITGTLPDRVRLSIPRSTRDIFHLKPLPFAIQEEIQRAGARPHETIGFGDGLTDILAFRLARLGGACLVKSCGAHPLQEAVHERLYTPGLKALGWCLSRRKAASQTQGGVGEVVGGDVLGSISLG